MSTSTAVLVVLAVLALVVLMLLDRRKSGRKTAGAPEVEAAPEPRADDVAVVPIEGSSDLHFFATRDIPSVVDEYVQAARERGFESVRIIHGRGKGVQRGIVQQVLENHPLVLEFWDATETHLGATVARLR